jgi:hypothetical protein
MMWAAQNMCGVFADIGIILKEGNKMAIAWQSAVGGSQ